MPELYLKVSVPKLFLLATPTIVYEDVVQIFLPYFRTESKPGFRYHNGNFFEWAVLSWLNVSFQTQCLTSFIDHPFKSKWRYIKKRPWRSAWEGGWAPGVGFLSTWCNPDQLCPAFRGRKCRAGSFAPFPDDSAQIYRHIREPVHLSFYISIWPGR